MQTSKGDTTYDIFIHEKNTYTTEGGCNFGNIPVFYNRHCLMDSCTCHLQAQRRARWRSLQANQQLMSAISTGYVSTTALIMCKGIMLSQRDIQRYILLSGNCGRQVIQRMKAVEYESRFDMI